MHAVPQPTDGSPEGAALSELVAFCVASAPGLTTAGVVQHFADSPHSSVLASALATAEDHGITAEHAAEHLKAGVARYWQQAQRAGRPGAPGAGLPSTTEETERLRQLEMVRRALPGIEPGITGRSS